MRNMRFKHEIDLGNVLHVSTDIVADLDNAGCNNDASVEGMLSIGKAASITFVNNMDDMHFFVKVS